MTVTTHRPATREEDMALRPWTKALLAVAMLYLLVYCLVEWTVAPLILLGVVLLVVLIRSRRGRTDG